MASRSRAIRSTRIRLTSTREPCCSKAPSRLLTSTTGIRTLAPSREAVVSPGVSNVSSVLAMTSATARCSWARSAFATNEMPPPRCINATSPSIFCPSLASCGGEKHCVFSLPLTEASEPNKAEAHGNSSSSSPSTGWTRIVPKPLSAEDKSTPAPSAAAPLELSAFSCSSLLAGAHLCFISAELHSPLCSRTLAPTPHSMRSSMISADFLLALMLCSLASDCKSARGSPRRN